MCTRFWGRAFLAGSDDGERGGILGGVSATFRFRSALRVLLALCAIGAAEQLWAYCASLASAATASSPLAGQFSGCLPFAQFLERVAAGPDPAAKAKVVDEFMACVQTQGTPLVEKGTKDRIGRAIFLYRGPATLVALAGDMNGWTPNEAFTQVSGTNLFYRADEYEMDARLDYKFVLNDKQWIFDSWNPRRITGGFGPNSYFAMPDYAPPPELEPGPSLRHGTIEEFSFASRILNNERAAKVYLPPGYAGSRERYKTLYVQDGVDYLNLGKINEIVDAMIQRNEIPPILMVMVPPLDRNKEYWANADFARAFATELVPAIDARYRTKPDAASRAVLGSSLGGLISIFLTGQYPQVIANCAGQSSAVFADTDLEKLITAPKSDVRFHIDVGTYESNVSHHDLLAGNRRLRDFLQSRGFAVEYHEVHEGHSWGNWPARIPEALRYFWALPSKRR